MKQVKNLTSVIPWLKDGHIILFFAVVKMLLHYFTYENFELHRDAYLYYAQSEHLAWGYVAVPPFVALVGKLATLIFGNTVFALKFFPALAGALNIVIIGLAVKELGGKRIALALAMLAYLLSPTFMHVNALFQPVSFNHLFWLLSCYLILLMIKRNDPKIWIWIALVFGVGFLNKYSIVFFYVAFAISLGISSHWKLYFSRYFLYALAVGLAIISPNLLWQYQHNFPVAMHMEELRETQLVHVNYADFIIDQFLMNMQALFIWLGALIILLFYKKEKQFRLFGWTYLLIIVLLLVGRGKSYYSLGIYPILFVFGAFFTEKYIKKYLPFVAGFFAISMLVSLYISLSFDGIPFTTFEKVQKKEAYRWEDGKYYDVPQDMSDMTGWKEIGETVAHVYSRLGDEKDNCDIFCYHYGQAGAVMFYGKKAGVPQPLSFNGSFVFWAADSLAKDYMIWVHSDLGNTFDPDSLLSARFKEYRLEATIDNRFFRENGTKIYLCKYPNDAYKEYYSRVIGELKRQYE
ncbi:MAG: glycosyltransferase family 39 protein [Bacteroidales bacterium]|nr:glycosyltransferase family 39 protein [Bacteroidales bacterium]MCF8404967.1 glycosyltransferase family 39 protein [Bacteroidales bacterium]